MFTSHVEICKPPPEPRALIDHTCHLLDARVRPANLLSELGRRPWFSNPLENLKTNKKLSFSSPGSGGYNTHVRRANDEWFYAGITGGEIRTSFHQLNFQIGLEIEEIARRCKVSRDDAACAQRPWSLLHIGQICASEGASLEKRIFSALPLHNS